MLRLAFIVAFALSCASGHAQRKVTSNGYSYLIDKAPAWIVPSPAPSPELRWSGQSPLRYLLADSQINLTMASPVRHYRMRMVPNEQTGLSEASQIRLQFNPAYETLTLHEVGVTRDGKRTDRLPKLKVELLQRETQLDRSVYDGWVTAFATIDDVRVGDIVDYSFSVRGANPVFGGKFSDQFTLNYTLPTDLRRVRVEYPANRSLNYRVIGLDRKPSVVAKGANMVFELVVSGLAPFKIEDRAARWAYILPELQIGEFSDWESVERWAKEHYRVADQASPELLAVAERIRREGKTPEETVLQALRFVQDEIRYFAVATGVSSHKPHPPNETLARRYGDCKDKTILTIALLGQLGIRARPALVSLGRLRQVSEWQPMPLAFDHVITEVSLDGRTYWLDATRNFQRGPLRELGFEYFGWALVVGADRRALTPVVAPPEYQSDLAMKERFKVTKFGAPVALTVTTLSSGAQAERTRGYIAAKDGKALAVDMEDGMKRRYPSLRRLRDPEITELKDRNQVSIVEYYEVPELFTYEKGRAVTDFYATSLGPPLQVPETVNRSFPLQLPYPAVVSHRFEYELPLDLRLPAIQPVNVAGPQFAFSYRSGAQGRVYAVDYEMRFLRDEVASAEMGDFLDRASKARVNLSRQLRLPSFDFDQMQKEYVKLAGAEDRNNAKEPDWMRRHLMDALARRMISEAAISAGYLDDRFLAEAWLEVATAKSHAGDRPGALEAIERALKLRPDLARAYGLRGEIRGYQGKFEAALEDLNRAASFKDAGQWAYSRAQIQYFLGQYKESLDVLVAEAGSTVGPLQSFRLLWLYMAAKRAGQDPVEALRRNGYRSERPEWPGPVLAYLVEDQSIGKLLDSARQDPREAAPRLCEAWFFIAQKRLLSGDAEGARNAFEQALATRIKPNVEYSYSAIELERIR